MRGSCSLRTSRGGRVRLVLATSAALVVAPLLGVHPAAAHDDLGELTYGITVKKVDRIAGLTGGTDGTADFYGKLTVGDRDIRTGTKSNDNHIAPNWKFSQTYARHVQGINAVISIWDSDVGADDHADIYPQSGKTLRLEFQGLHPAPLVDDRTGRTLSSLRRQVTAYGKGVKWETQTLTSFGTASDRARVTYTGFAIAEPDFVIRYLARSDQGRVVVGLRNAGIGPGRLTKVECSDGPRRETRTMAAVVQAETDYRAEIGMFVDPGMQVRCRIFGQNWLRANEPHSHNNTMSANV